jgi:predicted component of viral defense system (DUF524 family)
MTPEKKKETLKDTDLYNSADKEMPQNNSVERIRPQIERYLYL